MWNNEKIGVYVLHGNEEMSYHDENAPISSVHWRRNGTIESNFFLLDLLHEPLGYGSVSHILPHIEEK